MKVREAITAIIAVAAALYWVFSDVSEPEQCWVTKEINGQEVSKHRPCTDDELKALGEDV